MKYIIIAIIAIIFSYQSVNASENTLNKKYFTNIYNNLQNNHFKRGECVPFEIDYNIKGKIRFYSEIIVLEGPDLEGPNGINRFKPNCNDVVIFNEGDIYFGTYSKSNKLPHNLGVLKYKNGNMFIGEFINGNINGSGILYLADTNSVYVGDKFQTENLEWKSGVNLTMSGNCSLWSGRNYNGPNVNQNHHQFFYITLSEILFYGNCEKQPYDGTVVKRHGSWKGKTNDMTVMSGDGVMTYDDGGIYEGQWKDNLRHGKGSYKKYKISGDKKDKELLLSQVGVWKNDKLFESTEIATIELNDNYLFIGQIKNGNPLGNGRLYFKKGKNDEKIITGEWKQGEDLTYGTIRTSKYHYTGSIKNYKTSEAPVNYLAEGDGIKKYSENGATLRGTFTANTANGFGSMQWPNGDKYEGNFLRGMRHGEGVYTLGKGRGVLHDGSWCYGDKKQEYENEVAKVLVESYKCYNAIPTWSKMKVIGASHYDEHQYLAGKKEKSCKVLSKLENVSEYLIEVCDTFRRTGQ
tara:strand:+ start:147 stop:1706 length:1560 start_codon:yes stop_codon:yes gene_type:complete